MILPGTGDSERKSTYLYRAPEVGFAYAMFKEEKLSNARKVGDTYLVCLVHEGRAAFRLPMCQCRSLYSGQIW